MTVWGIGVRIDDGQPVVVAVELSGTGSEPNGRQVLLHRSEDTDTARALMLLANDLDHELRKNPPTVVVVRAMDWFRSPKERTVRPRLQVEGVLLEVCRRVVDVVEAHSGKEIGELCGVSKSEIEAEARRVLPKLDRDAVVAGLGALAVLGPVAEFAASRTACRLDANRPGLRPWARDLTQDEADMIGLATEHDITSIPKIELHVHFGGNFSEAIALELAGRHGLDPAVAS